MSARRSPITGPWRSRRACPSWCITIRCRMELISRGMFRELADVYNLVALKDSTENVRRITDLINIAGDGELLVSGVDGIILESVMLGAQGWVCALMNGFPHESRALWDRAAGGWWQEARAVYRWFMPLLHLASNMKLVQYIKLGMA